MPFAGGCDRKPDTMVSGSAGAISGFCAHHRPGMLAFSKIPALQRPTAQFGHVHMVFDEDGKLAGDAAGRVHAGICHAGRDDPREAA